MILDIFHQLPQGNKIRPTDEIYNHYHYRWEKVTEWTKYYHKGIRVKETDPSIRRLIKKRKKT